MIFRLNNGSEEKTFADWGLKGATIKFQSHAEDCLEFTEVAPIDQVDTFAFGSSMTIIRYDDKLANPVTIFSGIVVKTPNTGQANTENRKYEVQGPWWYLANTVFQQNRHSWSDAGKTVVDNYTSHLFLNFTLQGVRLTTGQQIQAVLDYLITNCSLPLQYDTTGFPALDIFSDEIKDTKCDEVIVRQLRWSPDSVSWFDYTTAPHPTFRCQRRSSLAPITLPLDGSKVSDLQIQPRNDLQVPGVVINYEVSNTDNGNVYVSIYRDQYPPGFEGTEPKAVINTINLQGLNISHQSQEIVTASIDAASTNPATQLAWWASHVGWVADDTKVDPAATIISNVQRSGSLPYELTSGLLASWMQRKDNNAPISFHSETITADVKTTQNSPTGSVGTKQIEVKLMTTDAISGIYTSFTVNSFGELIPTNFAKNIYDATSYLQYEGSFKIKEQDCLGIVAVGNTINFSGGLPEWSSMNAVVWGTDLDLDTGETTVRFGPISHLQVPDLLQMLRANRNRLVMNNPTSIVTAEASSNSTAPNPKDVTKGHANAAPGQYESFNIAFVDPGISDPAKNTGKIYNDASQAKVGDGTTTGSPPGLKDLGTLDPSQKNYLTLGVRQIQVCFTDANGNAQHRWVVLVCSDMFKLTTDPPDI